jgi:hypothetical protein
MHSSEFLYQNLAFSGGYDLGPISEHPNKNIKGAMNNSVFFMSWILSW